MGTVNWFKHQYNASDEVKMQLLFAELGAEGWGVYWKLVEVMHSMDGYLPAKLTVTAARNCNVSEEKILSVLNDFGLFELEERGYFAPWIVDGLAELERASKQQSSRIQKRWGKGNTVVIPEPSSGNTVVIPESSSGNTVVIPESSSGNTVVIPESSSGITVVIPESSSGITILDLELDKDLKKHLPKGKCKESAAKAAIIHSKAETEGYKSSGKAVQGTGKPLAERELDFRKEVAAYAGQYAAEMLEKFVDYWTEHSPGALRMRFEKQAVFDISRRLKRFEENDFGYSKKDKGNGKQAITEWSANVQRDVELGLALAEAETARRGAV
jgi:hypothetical protein